MHKEAKCFCLRQLCVLFVYLTTAVNSDNTNINCPRFCKCDSYLQLNRAQCSSRNLISAEVDLSNQVQILDLSYNDITIVDNKCFVNFTHLKYLNLSHNALHTLNWDAFFKLRRLTEIDFSYNRLEYLDERLFANNKYLNKINLEGNKLETLQNKPLLENSFVSELNLKKSQLNFLQPQLFAGLVNLKILDLSQNLLNNFNVADFQHLIKLQELNLNENLIKCDEIIRNKLKQLKERGVNVVMDKCSSENYGNSRYKTKIFEKMIMSTMATNTQQDRLLANNQWRLNLDLEEELTEENEEEEFSLKESLRASWKTNEWFRFAPDAILCNKHNFDLCQHYRSCLLDLNKVWLEKEQCPLNDIKLAFVMGIAIGVAAIVLLLACALCVKRCLEIKKPQVSTSIENIDDLPNQPLARLTTQLPPQVRRQPRRRAARPARSLVRYEGPVTENFLSRLFGRPARHQYYRTINHNTATLIRRLSRSNLFNNRLSQHFIDRQISNETSSSPEIEDCSASAPRPETPPPSYGDVVIKHFPAVK